MQPRKMGKVSEEKDVSHYVPHHQSTKVFFSLWPRRSLPGEQRWIWSGKMREAVSYDDASEEEKWIFLEY